ncbi:MAG: DUF3560 domain-containing protein [Anaerotignum sp.]|nr:DUF3560 domain-containing protein [Anaerotignum sp.]
MTENKEKWENSRIISSDDPDALEKLRKKLESLQKQQEYMKRANAYYKKHQTMQGFEGMNDATAVHMDSYIQLNYYGKKPFPSFQLENNNANIRRIKERIAGLEKRDSAAFGEGWAFPGGSVVMNAEENRIQVLFDEKPDEEMRGALKSNGFKWAPSKNAWQRQLNENGIRALRRIARIQPENA